MHAAIDLTGSPVSRAVDLSAGSPFAAAAAADGLAACPRCAVRMPPPNLALHQLRCRATAPATPTRTSDHATTDHGTSDSQLAARLQAHVDAGSCTVRTRLRTALRKATEAA